MLRIFSFSIVAAVCFLTQSFASESQKIRQPHSEVQLVSEVNRAIPGTPFLVALRLKADPNWHTYYLNPGDSGEPTRIEWSLPRGWKAGPIQWPTPQRVPFGPLVSYGYENEIFLLTELTPPARGSGTVAIRAYVTWLVCEKVCVPAEATLHLRVSFGGNQVRVDTEWEPILKAVKKVLPQPWTETELAAELNEQRLTLRWPAKQTATPEAYFFPENSTLIDHAALQDLQKDKTHWILSVPRSSVRVSTPSRLQGVLVLTDPTTATSQTLTLDTNLLVGKDVEPASSNKFSTVLLYLFWAFLGGLLLNLMPCVFPVLSIKVLGFVHQAHGDMSSSRKQGLSFAAGVVLSAWALAGVLLWLQATGEQVGWGFQLQSPFFVVCMITVLVAIALNLFGVFEVPGNWSAFSADIKTKNVYTQAFYSGLLTTLVATPCSAPFMGAAVGAALTLPPVLSFLIFTFLALGLSLPYVVLSASPALLKRLPRPGAWMETLKQFLAFPVLATNLWLLWVFQQQVGATGALLVLGIQLVWSLALWAFGKYQLRSRWAALFLLGGIVAGVFLWKSAGLSSVPATKSSTSSSLTPDAQTWTTYDAALIRTLESMGKPYFIDFTAAWCLTCQVNKQLVLTKQSVLEAFQRKGVALVRADWTHRDPVIAGALQKWGRQSVPVYVFSPGKGSEAFLLPEILTENILLEALDKIR